eukprot:6718148-Prorocentrum_lima.AAC.1
MDTRSLIGIPCFSNPAISHYSVQTRLDDRTMESTHSTRGIGGCYNPEIASFLLNLVSEAT